MKKTYLIIKRAINSGSQQFWRNKFTIFTNIILIAIFLFTFNCLLLFQQLGSSSIQTINSNVDLEIYIQNNIPPHTLTKLREEILNEYEITNITTISPEKSLEDLKEIYPNEIELVTKLNIQNPLPITIKIQTSNISLHPEIINYISNSDYQEYIISYLNNEQNIINQLEEKLINFNKDSKLLLFLTILVFSIISLIAIVQTIGVLIKRSQEEIEIIKLTGASNLYIQTQLFTEGFITSTISVFISFFISKILVENLYNLIPNLQSIYNLPLFQISLIQFFFILFIWVLSIFINELKLNKV